MPGFELLRASRTDSVLVDMPCGPQCPGASFSRRRSSPRCSQTTPRQCVAPAVPYRLAAGSQRTQATEMTDAFARGTPEYCLAQGERASCLLKRFQAVVSDRGNGAGALLVRGTAPRSVANTSAKVTNWSASASTTGKTGVPVPSWSSIQRDGKGRSENSWHPQPPPTLDNG
jgi:hypothetical protein